MGSYLIFNKKENNSKSISYPMATIIRDVLGDIEGELGWKLKKRHVAELVEFTLLLLNDDRTLCDYIEVHKEDYGFDSKYFKETLMKIHQDFTDSLVEMIFNKIKYIDVVWE